jgi:hypothetical protein
MKVLYFSVILCVIKFVLLGSVNTICIHTIHHNFITCFSLLAIIKYYHNFTFIFSSSAVLYTGQRFPPLVLCWQYQIHTATNHRHSTLHNKIGPKGTSKITRKMAHNAMQQKNHITTNHSTAQNKKGKKHAHKITQKRKGGSNPSMISKTQNKTHIIQHS